MGPQGSLAPGSVSKNQVMVNEKQQSRSTNLYSSHASAHKNTSTFTHIHTNVHTYTHMLAHLQNTQRVMQALGNHHPSHLGDWTSVDFVNCGPPNRNHSKMYRRGMVGTKRSRVTLLLLMILTLTSATVALTTLQLVTRHTGEYSFWNHL